MASGPSLPESCELGESVLRSSPPSPEDSDERVWWPPPCRWRQPLPEEIVTFASGTPSLTPDDVIVTCVAIDFTAGDGNPLDNVSFFDFPSSHEKKQLLGEHMTKLAMPAGYEVRPSCRRNVRRIVPAVRKPRTLAKMCSCQGDAAASQERTLRVYSRRSDRASVLAVERAAARYVKERLGHQVVCRTPQRAFPSERVFGGALEDASRKRKLHL